MTLTAQSVLQRLRKKYSPPKTFLDFETPFQLLVATVLSAQCTDARVNMTTPALFKKYPDPRSMAKAQLSSLEKLIHSCGTYRNKAKFISQLSKLLLERHRGEVPRTMAELTTLPGVGRKTASIILAVCFDVHEGIAVDTHVFRVARRLGLSKGRTPEAVERDLMEAVPNAQWGKINTQLIMLGRDVCTARNRECIRCPFKDTCPSSIIHERLDLGYSVLPKRRISKG